MLTGKQNKLIKYMIDTTGGWVTFRNSIIDNEVKWVVDIEWNIDCPMQDDRLTDDFHFAVSNIFYDDTLDGALHKAVHFVIAKTIIEE